MARNARTQRAIDWMEPYNRRLLARPAATIVGSLLVLAAFGRTMVVVTERTDASHDGTWHPVYQGILGGVLLYQLAMPGVYPRIVKARPDEVLLFGLAFGAAGFVWLSIMLFNFGVPAWVLVLDFPVTAVSMLLAMWMALGSRPELLDP